MKHTNPSTPSLHMAHHALLCFYETVSSGWRIQRPAPGQMLLPVFLSHSPGEYLGRRSGGWRRGVLIARWISRASKTVSTSWFCRALLVAPAEPYGPRDSLLMWGEEKHVSHTSLLYTLHQHMSSQIHSTAATHSNTHNNTPNYLNADQFFHKQHTIHCKIWEREKHLYWIFSINSHALQIRN